jgi:hypothetical protein
MLRHVKGIKTLAASEVNRTTARLNASFEAKHKRSRP